MSVRKSVLSLVRISTVTNPDVATFLRVENKHVLHSNSSVHTDIADRKQCYDFIIK